MSVLSIGRPHTHSRESEDEVELLPRSCTPEPTELTQPGRQEVAERNLESRSPGACATVQRETRSVVGERTPLWYRWSSWHLHQPRGVRWAINSVFVIASLAMFLGLGVVVATDPRFVGDEPGKIRAGLIVGGLFWCCAIGIGLLALRRDRRGAGLP